MSLEVFTNAAILSRLAYEDNPIETFEKQRGRCAMSLVVVKVVESQPVYDGTKMEVRQHMLMGIARRVGAEEPTIYFTFRGTDNIFEGMADCTINTFAGNLSAHIHKDFFDQAKTVPVDIIRMCLKNFPCVITGHSLGGAVSTMIGLDTLLGLSAFRFVNVWESFITFGALLVACHQLAMKASKEIFHNFVLSGDPVMILLNLLPVLLQKLGEEYGSKLVKVLQELLKAVVII
ncbi:hypothetical protein BC936DRAFT_145916 [Jimgerdemannia flammicorona]|uniref:Fungal lipase-type domain-containing protein n=1 Tax=Jimgerdemannia flammicorona TaxID=994334 RepID=A0A433D8T1_9FUNG|nr:hypothetical protein BC936DRAFT_145916 [Jimgerdemannia flammicorona]